MNPQQKKKPVKKHLSFFSGLVFCFFLPSAFAETKHYVVASPPDMLEHRVELVEPQGNLSLIEAMSFQLNVAKIERLIGGGLNPSSEKTSETIQ
ncbi:MAG: hypothetical protein KAT04_15745 [Methylococcales bacterium]|nr:hypothetical protein [Methylococcales bacterium]